jgi:hypothetical protein
MYCAESREKTQSAAAATPPRSRNLARMRRRWLFPRTFIRRTLCYNRASLTSPDRGLTMTNSLTHLTVSRPDPTEYATDFGNYVRLAPDGDLGPILAAQLEELKQLVGGLSEKDSLVRHAPYTWSIKQVVGHISDCERVFGYRALRLARNDATPLPSFDEQTWMQFCNFDRCPLADLLAEFEHLRRSHLYLFRQFEPQVWLRTGVVNGHSATVRTFAYVIAGHAKHHIDILHKRLAR